MGYATSDHAANPLCRAALGGGVSDKERTDILNWIADQREHNYASADTDPAHRNEPVQPIPRNIPVDAKKSTWVSGFIMMNVYPATAQYPVRIVTR